MPSPLRIVGSIPSELVLSKIFIPFMATDFRALLDSQDFWPYLSSNLLITIIFEALDLSSASFVSNNSFAVGIRSPSVSAARPMTTLHGGFVIIFESSLK